MYYPKCLACFLFVFLQSPRECLFREMTRFFFWCFSFGIRCTCVRFPFFLIFEVLQLRTAPVPCASQAAFPGGGNQFCILRAYMFIYVFV